MKKGEEVLSCANGIAEDIVFTHILTFNKIPEFNSSIFDEKFVSDLLEKNLKEKRIVEHNGRVYINSNKILKYPELFKNSGPYLFKLMKKPQNSELIDYIHFLSDPEEIKRLWEKIPQKYQNALIEEGLRESLAFTQNEMREIKNSQEEFPVLFFMPLRNRYFKAVPPVEVVIALRGEVIDISRTFPLLSFLYRKIENPCKGKNEPNPLTTLASLMISSGIKVNRKNKNPLKKELLNLCKITGLSLTTLKNSFNFITTYLNTTFEKDRVFLTDESFHLLSSEERYHRGLKFELKNSFPVEFSVFSFLEIERKIDYFELKKFFKKISKIYSFRLKNGEVYFPGKQADLALQFIKNSQLIYSFEDNIFEFKNMDHKKVRGRIYIQSNGEIILTDPVRDSDIINLSPFGILESWKEHVFMKIKREILINNRFRFPDETSALEHLEKTVAPFPVSERIKNLLSHEFKREKLAVIKENTGNLETNSVEITKNLKEFLDKERISFLKDQNWFVFKNRRDFQSAVDYLKSMGVEVLRDSAGKESIYPPTDLITKGAGVFRYLKNMAKGSNLEDEFRELEGLFESYAGIDNLQEVDNYFRKLIEDLGVLKRKKGRGETEKRKSKQSSKNKKISSLKRSIKTNLPVKLLIEHRFFDRLLKGFKFLKIYNVDKNFVEGWDTLENKYTVIPLWWIKEVRLIK